MTIANWPHWLGDTGKEEGDRHRPECAQTELDFQAVVMACKPASDMQAPEKGMHRGQACTAGIRAQSGWHLAGRGGDDWRSTEDPGALGLRGEQ